MKSNALGLRRLGDNIALVLLRQFIAILLGLGLSILFARTLGPKGNGFYTMVMLLPTLLATFSNLGVGSATVYFTSRQDFSVNQIIRGNLQLGVILSLLASIIGLMVLFLAADILFPGVPTAFLLLGLLVLPSSLLMSFCVAIFQGLQDFKRYNLLVVLPLVGTLFLAVISVWWMKGGVQAAIWANVLGYLNALIIAEILLKKNFTTSSGHGSASYLKSCLGYGWKAHLSNILAFLNYRLDMFLVNGFLTPAAVGIYIVAVQIAEKLWTLSQAASVVMLPRVAELKNNERLRREITPLISRWVLLVTFLVAILVWLLARWIVSLLFGDAFREAARALQLLLPGIAVGSMSRVLASDIAARGRPEINMYISGVALLTNLIANIILIPRMGIEGASIATTISYSLITLMRIIVYSKLTGVRWYKTIVPESRDLALVSRFFSLLGEKA